MLELKSRKALISLSSYQGAIFPDGSKTGVFFTEALHPYQAFVEAGFDVDFASETGTFGLDEFSLTAPFLAGADKAVFENKEHPFMIKLASQVVRAKDLVMGEYAVFFASAGHAALYDYPTARGLQAVAADVWNRGGVVGAVCHAPVLLTHVLDSKTGMPILEGRTVTGFTDEGEMVLQVIERLKADKVMTVAEAVVKFGARYSSPMQAFDDYSITDGRLITGTNPASARSAAERVLRAVSTLM